MGNCDVVAVENRDSWGLAMKECRELGLYGVKVEGAFLEDLCKGQEGGH